MCAQEGVIELLVTTIRPTRARAELPLKFLAIASRFADTQMQILRNQDTFAALLQAVTGQMGAHATNHFEACVTILRNLAFHRANRATLQQHAVYARTLVQLTVHIEDVIRSTAAEALWAFCYHWCGCLVSRNKCFELTSRACVLPLPPAYYDSGATERSQLWSLAQAQVLHWVTLAAVSSPVFVASCRALCALCGKEPEF